MGMPAPIYSLVFHEHGVRNVMQGILGFGGIAPIKRTLFGAMEAASPQTQRARLLAVQQLGAEGR